MPTREYIHRRRIQFYETDLAGIVHFSWYFRYMEEAEHALWRASGLSIADPASPVGFPRVAATCDYQAPLRFEDEIEIVVRIETINKRSIKYACTIVRGEMTVATGTLTAACILKAAGPPFAAAEIPREIVDKLLL